MKVTIFKVWSIRYNVCSCWRSHSDYLALWALETPRRYTITSWGLVSSHTVRTPGTCLQLSELGRADQPTLCLNRKLNNLLHLIYHFRIGIFARIVPLLARDSSVEIGPPGILKILDGLVTFLNFWSFVIISLLRYITPSCTNIYTIVKFYHRETIKNALICCTKTCGCGCGCGCCCGCWFGRKVRRCLWFQHGTPDFIP